MSARGGGKRVVARKIGVQLKPPALILLYRRRVAEEQDQDTAGKDAWRKRTMPLRRFTVNADLALRRQELQERHRPYLDDVPDVLVEKMLALLQETLMGQSLAQARARVEKLYTVQPDEDLNQTNPSELATKKRVMELGFLRNNIPPGDPRFEYDKQVEFHQAYDEISPWDDDKGDENVLAYDSAGKVNSVDEILPTSLNSAREDEDNFWD